MTSSLRSLNSRKGQQVNAGGAFLIGTAFEKNFALFPMLGYLEHNYPRQLPLFHLIVDSLQTLGFALAPLHNTWSPVFKVVLQILFFFHIPIFDGDSLQGSFVANLVFASIFFALLLFLAFGFSSFLYFGDDDLNRSFFGPVVLGVLGHFVYFVTSVGFVPLLQNFISMSFCSATYSISNTTVATTDDAMSYYAVTAETVNATRTYPGENDRLLWFPGETCYTDIATLYAMIATCLGCTILVLLTYMFQTCVFEINPLSRHHWCRSNTRLDGPFVLWRVITVALMHHFYSRNQMMYFAIWMAITSLIFSFLFSFTMPYYRPQTLRIRSTGLFLAGILSIFAAISHNDSIKNYFVKDAEFPIDLVITFCVVLIFGCVFAWKIALSRISPLMVAGLKDLQEGYVERSITHFPQNLPLEDKIFSGVEEIEKELVQEEPQDEMNDEDFHFTLPYVDYINYVGDIELATRFLVDCKEITGKEPTGHQLAYAARIYCKGISKYRDDSGSLRVQFGIFFTFLAGKPRLAQNQLTLLKTAEAPMWVRFQAWKLQQRIASLVNVGASSRIEAFSRAKRRHKDALHHTSEFWQLLLNDDVDKAALSNSTRAILAAKADVFRTYERLLVRHPTNMELLSSYAVFCDTVLLDRDAALQCHQCLREIRDLKNANHMRGAKSKIVDKETMTQIPLDIMEDDEEATENANRIQNIMCFVSFLLLLLLIGFIILTFIGQSQSHQLIQSIIQSGRLRTVASQCVVGIQDYTYQVEANSSLYLIEEAKLKLQALQADFQSLHNALTYGPSGASLKSHLDYNRAGGQFVLEDYTPTSYWALGRFISVALREVLKNPSTPLKPWLIEELPMLVGPATNQSVRYFRQQFEDSLSLRQILSYVFLGLIIVAVCIAMAVVHLSIHRSEGTRGDIFSLFTLIPRKVLKTLVKQSKKRLQEVDHFLTMKTKDKIGTLIGYEMEEASIEKEAAGSIEKKEKTPLQEQLEYKQEVNSSDSDDDAAKAAKTTLERNLTTDVSYTGLTPWITLFMIVVGIAMAGVAIYGYSVPDAIAESTRNTDGVYAVIAEIRSDARKHLTLVQEYTQQGQKRQILEYYGTATEGKWNMLERALLAAEVTNEGMMEFHRTRRAYEALQEIQTLCMRMAFEVFPMTDPRPGTEIYVNVSQTPLASFTWGPEKDLLYTEMSQAYGLSNYEMNLIEGSDIDLALPTTELYERARSIIFSEQYRQFYSHFRDVLSKLNEKNSQKDSFSSLLIAINGVLVGCSCFVAILLVYLIYLRFHSHVFDQPIPTILLSVCALAIIALVVLSIVSIVTVASFNSGLAYSAAYQHLINFRQKWIDITENAINFPRYFTQDGDLRWLLKFRDESYETTVDMSTFSQVVVRKDLDLPDCSAEELKADEKNIELFMSELNGLKHLGGIISTITYEAYYSAIRADAIIGVQNVMNSSFLDEVQWNHAEEPNYRDDLAVYGSGNYHNRTYDLTQRTAVEMRSDSMTFAFSDRTQDILDNSQTPVKLQYQQLLDVTRTKQEDFQNFERNICAGVLGCSLAYAIGMILIALVVFVDFTKHTASKLIRRKRGGSAEEAASAGANVQQNESIFSPTKLPFLTYAIVIALALLLIILVTIDITTEMDMPKRLDFAVDRLNVAAATMAVGNDMESGAERFIDARFEAGRLLKRLKETSFSLYFDGKSKLFSVAKDAVQDAMLFDVVTSNNFQNPFVCNASRGESAIQSLKVGVGLLYDSTWSNLVRRMSSLSDPRGLSPILQQMRYFYEGLTVGLMKSTERYETSEKDKAQQWTTGIAAAAIVGAVLIIAQHFFVIQRFVNYLSVEESSARLMLKIIPEEARIHNSHIAAFLEGGAAQTRETDSLNDAIANMSTLPVIAIDAKGIIQRFTVAAENVFGYTASEVVGANVSILMPEYYAKNHDSYLANYRRTKVKHVIGMARRVEGMKKSGEIFPVELSVNELKLSEEESIFIGFAKDVGGDLELQSQDRMNKSVIEMAKDAIITIDANGQILSTNSATTTIFGFSRDEMVRENVKMLMPSEIALQHDGYLQRYRETGVKKIVDGTRRLQAQRKNGEIFQASVTVREIKGTRIGELSTFIGYIVDVTREHEATSQGELTDIVSDLSPVPIIAINDQGTFVKFSKAACELFGYSRDDMVAKAQNIQVIVPPSYGDHQRYIDNYIHSGVRKVIDSKRRITAMKRDGTIFPCQLTLKEIKKQGMRPVFLGYLEDFSVRQKVEEITSITGTLVNHSMIPIVAADATGQITMFNEAAELAFGYSKEEAIGSNVKILMPKAIAHEHDKFIRTYMQTKIKRAVDSSRVVEGKKKDGTLFPCELVLREIPETQHTKGMFFAYIRDVTSQRRTFQQFLINDGFTSLSVTPIVVMNAAGIIESFSPSAEDCFGYSQVDVVGENIKILMPQEVAEKHDEYLRRYAKTGLKRVVDSTRLVTAKKRDGSLFELEISVKEVKKEGSESLFVGYCRDSTKDNQLEEERSVGETIRDLSAIPIIQIGVDGIIGFANNAACQEFQYTAVELIGKNVNLIQPPEIAAAHDGFIRRYLANPADSKIVGKTVRVPGKRKDGSTVDLEVKVAEIRSKKGSMRLFVAFLRPMSLQLKLEQANRMVDTITNLSTVPIVATDHRGVVIKFSEAAEKAFGFHAEEVLGQNVKMLMPQHIADKHDGFIRTYLRTGVKVIIDNTVRQEGKKKDGTKIMLDLSIKEIVKQGQNSQFIGYLRDASEDAALERATDLSNLVIRVNPIPIIVTDWKGIVKVFNEAAVKTFGFLAEEIVGENVTKIMVEEDAKYHNKYLKTYAKTKIRSAVGSVKQRIAQTKGGTRIPVEIKVTEIPSKSGESHNQYLGIVRDLTNVSTLQQTGAINDAIATLSSVPLIAINASGTVLRFSNNAEACFGYEASEVLGKNVSMLMPQDLASKHDMYLKRAANAQRSEELSFRRTSTALHQNGSTFPVKIVVREVKKTGQESLYVAYIENIAKKLELQRKKNICESTIAHSLTPIVRIDATGIIKSFNAAAEDCFGYSQQEVVGHNVKALMPRNIAEQHDSYISNYMKTGNGTVINETRVVTGKRKNGKKFPVSLCVTEFWEGEERLFVGYMIDKTMSAALEQASDLNSAIVKLNSAAIVGITPKGAINMFSPQAESMFGYSSIEVLGSNVNMLMPEPHFSKHNEYLENMRIRHEGGTKKIKPPLTAVHKSGRTFPIELSISTVGDLHSDDFKIVASIIDVSDAAKKELDIALASISETMSEKALIAIDQDGAIIKANRALCGLFGYEAGKDLIGCNVSVLMPRDVGENHSAYLHNYLRTGSKHMLLKPTMVTGITKRGLQMSLKLEVKEIKLSSGKSVFAASMGDARREKELTYAGAMNTAVLSLIPTPVIVATPKGIIKEFNVAAEKLFEFRSDQVVGKNVNILMPEELQQLHDGYLERFSRTGERRVQENRIMSTGETKSGKEIPLEITLREVRNESGEMLLLASLRPTK